MNKKIVSILMAFFMVLALVIVPETDVNAANGDEVSVYYGFKKVSASTDFEPGKTYIFVPASLGEMDEDNCLVGLPAGSAILESTTTTNGCKSYASYYGYGDADFCTYVNVKQSGTGFDTCTRGGLFDGATAYFCLYGGASNIKGSTYEYKEGKGKVTANVKDGVNINPEGTTTLSKDDIEMKVEIEGDVYGTKEFTVVDNTIDPSKLDNKITVKFGSTNIDIEVSIPVDIYATPVNGTYGNLPDDFTGYTELSVKGDVVKTDELIVTYKGTMANGEEYYSSSVDELKAPTQAGSYSVTFDIDSLMYFGTKTVEFTIDKAVLTIVPDELNKVYGEEDPKLTYTSKGIVDGDEVTGNITREAGEDVKEGGYSYSLGDISANENYIVELDNKPVFSILPKPVKDEMITLTPNNKVYDGKALEPKITVKDGEKTLVENVDYKIDETSVLSETNVGDYSIVICGIGNYKDSAKSVYSIDKATITEVAAAGITITKDGNGHSISVEYPEKATILYSLDGKTYTEKKPEFIEPGEYVVYYKVSMDNYSDYEGSEKVIIEEVVQPTTEAAPVDSPKTGEADTICLLFIFILVSLAGIMIVNEKKNEIR